MTLATERNVTDNWKSMEVNTDCNNGWRQSGKRIAVVMPEEWRQKIGNQNQR